VSARAARAEQPPIHVIGDGGAPNLQALVEQFDGYHLIPPEAWAQYDAELGIAWQRLMRLHKPQRGLIGRPKK
jgi:hypothetical protein